MRQTMHDHIAWLCLAFWRIFHLSHPFFSATSGHLIPTPSGCPLRFCEADPTVKQKIIIRAHCTDKLSWSPSACQLVPPPQVVSWFASMSLEPLTSFLTRPIVSLAFQLGASGIWEKLRLSSGVSKASTTQAAQAAPAPPEPCPASPPASKSSHPLQALQALEAHSAARVH